MHFKKLLYTYFKVKSQQQTSILANVSNFSLDVAGGQCKHSNPIARPWVGSEDADVSFVIQIRSWLNILLSTSWNIMVF